MANGMREHACHLIIYDKYSLMGTLIHFVLMQKNHWKQSEQDRREKVRERERNENNEFHSRVWMVGMLVGWFNCSNQRYWTIPFAFTQDNCIEVNKARVHFFYIEFLNDYYGVGLFGTAAPGIVFLHCFYTQSNINCMA